jgi:hypothetical protein
MGVHKPFVGKDVQMWMRGFACDVKRISLEGTEEKKTLGMYLVFIYIYYYIFWWWRIDVAQVA